MRCLFSLGALYLLATSTLAAPLGKRSTSKSFAGGNNYYAAALPSSEWDTLFSGMQGAGMKVLRAWIGHQDASQKGSDSSYMPDLEENGIGQYNDQILNAFDDMVLVAHKYGIKILLTMHSFNALQANDAYGKIYGTGYFYEQSAATTQFDARLSHILNHNHTTLGKPWKELKDYFFAVEAENEAMIGKGADYIAAHASWQCDRAKTIKGILGDDSGILVTTGGESWVSESMQSAYFSCEYLDMISVHGYGDELSSIPAAVETAQNAGKKLLFEEWGICYNTNSNNDCPSGGSVNSNRDSEIAQWSSAMNSAGLPWLYWQFLTNPDPHQDWDYEIQVGGDDWSAIKSASQAAANSTCAFDFSGYID
ncbi:hypothetical protein NQZ79_g1024 [Umbelopsis isabellina]|nr:hypothetical protein NQZ79_g1024 [Umbelopsis isabellina]